MDNEGKLLAVQLANQQLAARQRQMEAELDGLRAENQRLLAENRRLEKALARAEQHQRTLEQEYHRKSGERYQGKVSTTKFGFSSSQ